MSNAEFKDRIKAVMRAKLGPPLKPPIYRSKGDRGYGYPKRKAK